jgi:hypothetical protein
MMGKTTSEGHSKSKRQGEERGKGGLMPVSKIPVEGNVKWGKGQTTIPHTLR